MDLFPTVETAAPLIGLVSRINYGHVIAFIVNLVRVDLIGEGWVRLIPSLIRNLYIGVPHRVCPGFYRMSNSCCNVMYSYYHCQYGGASVKCWPDNENPLVPVSPSASGQAHIARDLSCGRLSIYYVLSVWCRSNPSSSSSARPDQIDPHDTVPI